MTTTNFRNAAAEDAGGQASVGRGKLALVPEPRPEPLLVRCGCRDARPPHRDDQALLAQIATQMAAAAVPVAHSFIADFYISLKTNPFVILVGAEACGKMLFVEQFANALVGAHSLQYACVPGAAYWSDRTGAGGYYRGLHERFGSWRFLELLQEAAAPENQAKLYIACFSQLHPEDLDYYFTTLLRVGEDGSKRLDLPGFPPDELPAIPPNLLITATLDANDWNVRLSHVALRHAGLIAYRTSNNAPTAAPARPALLPPVGYQRLWLRGTLRQTHAARDRLLWLLGPDALGRLRPSHDLSRLLWRSGYALTSQMLGAITVYVANSFDEQGGGLFDSADRQRNAQIAFDAQLAQRVLWQLNGAADQGLRHELVRYLAYGDTTPIQQAVA